MAGEKRVYLISGDDSVHQVLGCLSTQLGFKLSARTSGPDFRDIVDDLQPGCIVLDLQTAQTDVQELQDHLQKARRDMAVIAIVENGGISAGVRAIKTGAIDFIEKPLDALLLEKILLAAFEAPKGEGNANARSERILSRLTAREVDVLRMSSHEDSIAEIARLLHVNRRTIASDRASINKKLGSGDFSEALQVAMNLDLPGHVASTSSTSDPKTLISKVRHEKLAALITIAEEGDLLKVSEKLQKSKKEITHLIHELENRMNVKLVQRAGHSLRLTSQAKELLPYIKAYMTSIEDIARRLGSSEAV